MFSVIFILVLFAFSYGNALSHKFMSSNDMITPCSTNISNAYLGIFLMIDVSTNMGETNLKQLALSLSSEFAKIPITTACTRHKSQFSVITYADTATMVANMTQIKSNSDLTNALLNLKITNSSSVAGMANALGLASTEWNAYQENGDCNIPQVALYVYIGASLNQVVISILLDDVDSLLKFGDSLLTINFNPQDQFLTTVFNIISVPSFNLSIANKNVYQDLAWAITQSNCFCNPLGDGPTAESYQLYYFNSNINKWERSADCYAPVEFVGVNLNDNNICAYTGMGHSDAAVTSSIKQTFIEEIANNTRTNWFIGLHRNGQNQWYWLDFDGNQVPLGNYQPWTDGYNASSPGECVMMVYDPMVQNYSLNYRWTPTSCQTTTNCLDDGGNGCVTAICQLRACDADLDGCFGPISKTMPNRKNNKIIQKRRRNFTKFGDTKISKSPKKWFKKQLIL